MLNKNKKGSGIDLTHSLIVFLILNVLFFSVLFFFVGRAGSGATIYEQKYAKQIALAIDSAKPGTNITIDLSEAYGIARKNNILRENLVKIDPKTNEVIVKLTQQGEGYSFKHFNNAPITWGEDFHFEKLHIQIKENKEGGENAV